MAASANDFDYRRIWLLGAFLLEAWEISHCRLTRVVDLAFWILKICFFVVYIVETALKLLDYWSTDLKKRNFAECLHKRRCQFFLKLKLISGCSARTLTQYLSRFHQLQIGLLSRFHCVQLSSPLNMSTSVPWFHLYFAWVNFEWSWRLLEFVKTNTCESLHDQPYLVLNSR